MQERPQNFEEVGDDPEVRLPSPRFDADEARRAHPVVPLSEAQAFVPARPRRTRFGGVPRRHLLLALLAVVLLSLFAFGGVLALRRAHTKTPVPNEAAQDSQATQSDAAPQQTAPAPPHDALPQADATNAQENTSAQTPSAPAPKAADEEQTGDQKTEDSAAARAREERAAHSRRAEESGPPPFASRAGRGEVGGEDLEHRGRLKEHDARDPDADEKEALRAGKHAKKGQARLVDVLVGRPRP
jgi:cytoskeletal protein RodZ